MLTSSYSPGEVTFLLTDLSAEPLEQDLLAREHNIRAGHNYAEMLPIEYQPEPQYLALFDRLVAESAQEVAEHVGVVTEQILAARGSDVVITSLARAGTPIGILVRRWAEFAYGIRLSHYSISIVRGRGIDMTALDYIVARHDPAHMMFLDGWTGKGAIATELADALAAYAKAGRPQLPGELAVVADPAGCATFFGTREDILVPSACLNSTVCGLVSRTVLNDELIKPGMFHGAKVYRELAESDRSQRFLDAISDAFPIVREKVAARAAAEHNIGRGADWRGLDTISRVQREFGLSSWHLLKPGIGETTRVLLRRLPWKVLARPDRSDALRHIHMLAAVKGVPVIEYPDMPYSCVGLIRPG